MARTKKPVVNIPPIPEGKIPTLAPLDRGAKIKALEMLATRATRELTPFINEISTKLVFGEGDPDAPVLFVGEGPGIEEDRTGRPFVGKSGQLLDKQIKAMGYAREQVFIANIVKLRAASMDEATNRLKDRPPLPEEVARQIHILHEQIEIIRPKAIVTLGAPAIKWLLGVTEGVMKIRGTWLEYRGIPVMPTYHPAFLLRSYTEENRRKVWEDLQKVMAILKGK